MRKINCLITGASSGIGKSISLKLSKYAKHIYILARNVSELEKVNDKIVNNGCSCTIVPLDLCADGGIENLSQQIFQKDKSLDLIVLSAGQIDHLSPVDSINLEKLNSIINLNFIANFRMIRNFHLLLKNSTDSHLAVISSLKSQSRSQYWGIYQPIMTALNEMVMIYAHENINTNIKANIFCPKGVRTKLRDVIMPGEDNEKIMLPDEFAEKILELLLKCDVSGKVFDI